MIHKPNKWERLIAVSLTIACYPVLSLLAQLRGKKTGNAIRVVVMPQISQIGDIVCSTPVFYNIKKHYPESFLSVLVSKKAAGIIKNNPKIDEIIIIEDYSSTALINKLRRLNFNWSINLSATSINTCIALWSGIAHRIKTKVETPPITERLTDFMSNHRLLYKNHTYLPAHHIRLLRFMGIEHPEDRKEVFLTPEGEQKAQSWKESLGNFDRIIGISITAGNKIKELGDDKFETIVKALLKNENVIIACIGSPNDAEQIHNLVNKIGSSRFVPVLNFNLEELPSLMKRFSLYIAVDTGPIYIAHALNVPLIDIIGPVDPKEQPPQDALSVQILARGNVPPSSFVFKRRGNKALIQKALEETFPEDIISAANRML